MGYLAGGQGYYNQEHDRNSTCANHLGACLGPDYSCNYSSIFFADESIRIVENHDPTSPLFLYLAFQSVHNPYDVPPMDVNASFPDIVDYTRRIYAGMVQMMDDAIHRVVQAFQTKGLWHDTVVIFTSDNGGIGPGSNYPLRGTKVYNWEGGIKAAGFVRGTNNPHVAPLPNGTTCTALMHATDWFSTLVQGVAGGTTGPTLPLDGVNQWPVLQGRASTNRTTIFHNVPVGAKPIPTGTVNKHGRPQYTTSMCMHNVDNRTLPCSPFGLTGGAMRQDNWKLLITAAVIDPNGAPWGDTTPPGMKQIPPGGTFPNGTRVFTPTTHDTVPEPFDGQYYLFDISQDPTESHNLAQSMPVKLQAMMETYATYAAATAVPALSWRWGFTDPNHENNPGTATGTMARSDSRSSFWIQTPQLDSSTVQTENVREETCMGPFLGSEYCAYGHEWECYVMGNTLVGFDLPIASDATTSLECQAACLTTPGCAFWVLSEGTTSTRTCQLKSDRGRISPCNSCVFGPKECPS
jgi:arylsulfatase A-like enzyme